MSSSDTDQPADEGWSAADDEQADEDQGGATAAVLDRIEGATDPSVAGGGDAGGQDGSVAGTDFSAGGYGTGPKGP
jgi:hypothetical protein